MAVLKLRYIDINKAVLACDVCAATLEQTAADFQQCAARDGEGNNQ